MILSSGNGLDRGKLSHRRGQGKSPGDNEQHSPGEGLRSSVVETCA